MASTAGGNATVRLGYLASSFYPDGSIAGWGRDMRLAVELAIGDVNAQQLPVQLELAEVFETNGTTSDLPGALQDMMAAGAVAVLGADWSRVALQAAAILTPCGVPLLPAGATSASLDNLPAVFRTIYSDSQAAHSITTRLVSQCDSM
jgi:ABC-type branched-subunit amino acid transport system substrate-binding protein